MQDYDVFVIGGGINGCGIARDAAGRGYSVCLAEKGDLGSGTSSWSTKLIHGGLRYLEHYEFRLVREALREREVLWAIAPHLISPLRFILPYHSGLRPAWMLRTGLFLYDHLGGRRQLPATRGVDLAGPLGAPLKPAFRRGFEYSDARVDDTRLVVLNARCAAMQGASILVRTEVRAAVRDGASWRIDLCDTTTGQTRSVRARYLVNAAGPWVDMVLRGALAQPNAHNIRLVQGSHIVLRRLYEHDRAYIFQNGDGRIVFAIPYEQHYTLVGTTDRDFEGDPARAAISEGEIDYLLGAAGEYFAQPLRRDDIVWSFSGVRPLFDDQATSAQEATRDYVLKIAEDDGGAGLLNIFGGKITTYRKLAEDAVEAIGKGIGKRGAPWTASRPLPGGNFPMDGVDALVERLRRAAPGLAEPTLLRMVRAYGTDAIRIAGRDGPGRDLGHGLHERELDWMIAHEWARDADDVLWRRSKLGLQFDAAEKAALARHVGAAVDRAEKTGMAAE